MTHLLSLATREHFESLLDAAVLTHADETAPAIIYLQTGQPDIHITRKEFRAQVMQYAAALENIGIAPRDLVILAHTQNLESICAFWGALLLGAVPSMFPTLTEKLDPDIYMRSMAELVSRSDVRAVLTTDDFAPVLAQRVACGVYGSRMLKPTSPSAETATREALHTRRLNSLKAQAQQIALLQHSSGTTGLQKGVALSHQAVLNQLAAYSDRLALTEQDVIVSWLPLYHDMGLIAGFLLPLVQGIPLVLMSPFDWVQHPALLFRAINDYKGTLCWLPNFAYNHCARRVRERDLAGLSLRSMRAFINCSEPVRADSHALFLERFANIGAAPEMLTVSYAMAENVFAVTQTPIGQPAKQDVVARAALEHERLAIPITNAPQTQGSTSAETDPHSVVINVSCGAPIRGTDVKILTDDAERRELPPRHIGEIAIRSDCLLTGYYKRDDLNPFTAEGWYLTGDMGYIADGEIYIVGRKKDLIINGGKNVYPGDIEAIVNTVAGVHPGRAVAFGVPDEREGTELIAVVAEIDQTDDADANKQISAAIRAAVAKAAAVTVSYVELVDEKWLIKTSSGKIARAANREKWLAARQMKG